MNNLTVVMYHYVRNLKNSRYPNIKGLELSLFEEQLKFLKKHYVPVTMNDVLNCFYNNEVLPNKAVLLTFDDAYLDHFINAYPLLKKYNMQGSFYTPAKVIEEGELLDVNKIHFILASNVSEKTIINDIKSIFLNLKKYYEVKSFDEYYTELAIPNRFDTAGVIFIKRLLQVALPIKMRNEICNILFERYIGMDESAFSKELYMDKNHLAHLISDGMHVGSHGYDHFWWNKLKHKELELEIDKSLTFLKSVGSDITNWTACYPYGSCSSDVVSYLKSKGCKLAFTTEPNTVNVEKINPLLLPRLDTNDLPKKADAEPNEWY